jgi:hypothetical protein
MFLVFAILDMGERSSAAGNEDWMSWYHCSHLWPCS